MPYPLCRHIKTNGSRCQAPALTGAVWCYFHNRLHQSHNPFCHSKALRPIPGLLRLSALEDIESVQLALSLVINALATGHLEAKRASALLYGLQLASRNAARLRHDSNAPDIVRSVISSPEGLDLAETEAILELNEPPTEKTEEEENNNKEGEEDKKEEIDLGNL